MGGMETGVTLKVPMDCGGADMAPGCRRKSFAARAV